MKSTEKTKSIVKKEESKGKSITKKEESKGKSIVKKEESGVKMPSIKENVKRVVITIEVKAPKPTPKPVLKNDKIDALFAKAKREILDGPAISLLPPEIEVAVARRH